MLTSPDPAAAWASKTKRTSSSSARSSSADLRRALSPRLRCRLTQTVTWTAGSHPSVCCHSRRFSAQRLAARASRGSRTYIALQLPRLPALKGWSSPLGGARPWLSSPGALLGSRSLAWTASVMLICPWGSSQPRWSLGKSRSRSTFCFFRTAWCLRPRSS